MKRRWHIIQRPKKPPDKGQTMIYKTLHRKLKIEQQKPTKTDLTNFDGVFSLIPLFKHTYSSYSHLRGMNHFDLLTMAMSKTTNIKQN
jgi:hypothetical protein